MLTPDEQRAARSAGRLAADALIHDTFPDSHIGGGSSFARGWTKGHRTDWDRKSFRVQAFDLDKRESVTVASVRWTAIRRHGRTMPNICAGLAEAITDHRVAEREYGRTVNYHRKGDPDAAPWAVMTFGPIDQPAIDEAWERMLTACDEARARINELLDEAFPLALVEREPVDLLELLEAM